MNAKRICLVVVLSALAGCSSYDIEYKRITTTSAATLSNHSRSPSAEIRAAAATNPNLPLGDLIRLAGDDAKVLVMVEGKAEPFPVRFFAATQTRLPEDQRQAVQAGQLEGFLQHRLPVLARIVGNALKPGYVAIVLPHEKWHEYARTGERKVSPFPWDARFLHEWAVIEIYKEERGIYLRVDSFSVNRNAPVPKVIRPGERNQVGKSLHLHRDDVEDAIQTKGYMRADFEQ